MMDHDGTRGTNDNERQREHLINALREVQSSVHKNSEQS
jgi:hypothetical protein